MKFRSADAGNGGKLPEFVIWAPSFDENSGGCIALHYLCKKLRENGFKASIWPAEFKVVGSALHDPLALLRNLVRNRAFDRSPFDNPVARYGSLKRAIAIYPEIVPGNPFGSQHVVRWHLHKKGFFQPGIAFSDGEIDVFYQSYFAPDDKAFQPGQILRLRWVRSDLYRDPGKTVRSGACRMIRKGQSEDGQSFGDNYPDALILDGKSHEEISRVFQEKEIFICHDPYTMYGYYAALSGCTPVILPIAGRSESDWRPKEEDRWGLAYGFERIDWAKSTRDLMLTRFMDEEREENEQIMRLVDHLRRSI